MHEPLPVGWTPRGDPIEAPGGTLARVTGPAGEIGLAVRVRADLADHPIVQKGMDEVEAFVWSPGVPGVLPLVGRVRNEAVFVYEIGEALLLAEILDACADRGLVPGERVAVELVWRTASILDAAAARAGGLVGIYAHGALNPWRILVHPDGEVSLLAYGLPPVEVVAWLDEDTDADPGPGFRYSPPERIQDDNEDVRADLFALGLSAAELALGGPVLKGSPQDLVDRILGDAALERIEGLSEPVKALLGSLVTAAVAERARTGGEVALKARSVLRILRGRTLSGLARGAYDEQVDAIVEGITAPPERALPLPSALPTLAPPEPEPEPLAPLGSPTPVPVARSARAPLGGGRIPIPMPRIATASGVVDFAEEAVTVAFERPVKGAVRFDDDDDDDDSDESFAPLVVVDPTPPAPAPPPPVAELPVEILPPTRPPEPVLPAPLEESSPEPEPEPEPEPVLADPPPPDPEAVDPDAVPTHTMPAARPPEDVDPDLVPTDVTRAVTDEPAVVDWTYVSDDATGPEVVLEEDEPAPPIPEDELHVPVLAEDDDAEAFDPDATVSEELIDDGSFEIVPRGTAGGGEGSGRIPMPRAIEFGSAGASAPPALVPVPDVLHLLTVTVDFGAGAVITKDGQVSRLSATQLAVLGFLAARPERDLTKEDVWHGALGDQGSPDSVRGIIQRLRKKIERDPGDPDHLLNVPGVGFRFEPGEQVEPSEPAKLPEPKGSLFGREEELVLAKAALEQGALVSVVGPPGSGATQVALRAARALADDGWEVHRCAVGSPDAVATALAKGLGVRKTGRKTTDVLADVGRILATRDDVLVFLDAPNDPAPVRKIVAGWVEQAPTCPILVTARGPLDVEGERVIRLEPLPEDLAVELFRKRVAEIRGGEVVDEAVARAIVRHLDRMPVALEAAAAETEFTAPAALLARLEQGQELGEGGIDATLAATIERLDPVERTALEQCVVFREGFDLAAAESVIALPDRSRSVITVIDSLCARSLLRVVSGADTANVRWNLYETARSHIRRTLAGDAFGLVQRRHALSYGQLGLKLGGRPWAERPELAILVRERENLRGAVQEGGAPAAGAALGLTSLLGREPAAGLAEAVERVLADPGLAEPGAHDWRVAARLASARIHSYLGQFPRARADLRAAMVEPTLDPQLNRSEFAPILLAEVARLHTELGSTFEAEQAASRVSTSDAWVLAVLAILRGRGLAAVGETKRADRAFVEALHGFSALDADIGQAHTQRHYAEMLAVAGQAKRAVAMLREAMAVFRDVGDAMSATQCQMRLAELLVGMGQGEEAAKHLEEVMRAARDASANATLALARGVLGVVRTMEHQWEEAERLFVLAIAGAPQKRIQALFALNLLLKGDADAAHEEAKVAQPEPIAVALMAVLERQSAPKDGEAFLVWEALEAWRAAASTARIVAHLGDRASVAVRMILACPRTRPQRNSA